MLMLDQDTKTFLTECVTARFPDVLGFYLFGSQASGSARPDSDIDVAILVDKPVEAEAAFELKTDLSSKFKKDVDLVDLLRCDSVTAAQVAATGILVWAADPYRCAVFETTAFSTYALLNEERRDILADIQREGRIYGR